MGGDNAPDHNSSMRLMRPQYNNSLPISVRRISDGGGKSPNVKVRILDTNNKNEGAARKPAKVAQA